MRRTGLLELSATGLPCLLEGPINSESFAAWIEQLLAPSLRGGDIVMMDNPSSHEDPAGRSGSRRQACSSDLNPIEQAFSKPKTLLRKENARSLEEIEAAIRKLLPKLTPEECINFFNQAGTQQAEAIVLLACRVPAVSNA